MAIELKQGSTQPTGTASFVDDQSGNRSLHLAANARVDTTLYFKIDQTSPGIVQGLGGDTNVTIPGGAIPTRLRMFGKLNDAVTAANVTVGLDNVTSNHFLSGLNVANAPTGLGQQTPSAVTNLFQALPVMALGQAHNIIGHYAVAGTSTGGGPWYFALDYYFPEPA